MKIYFESRPRPLNQITLGTRRLITEATAYILYVGFVIEEINEARLGHIIQQKWKSMRMGQVQSDLKVCLCYKCHFIDQETAPQSPIKVYRLSVIL